MPRTAGLTDRQWADIEKRVERGESMRAVAKHYKVSEGCVRRRIRTRITPLKNIANQLAAAELAVERLPQKAQVKVRELTDILKGITHYIGEAAEQSAMTTMRLAQIANAQSAMIDQDGPLMDMTGEDGVVTKGNADAVKAVMIIQEAANRASHIPLALLTASKGKVQQEDGSMTLEQLVISSGVK